MARNEKEVSPRRPRTYDLLRRSGMLIVLYYQVIIRYQVFQAGNGLGEVRTWDLHIVHFVQVRHLSIERVPGCVSDTEVSASRSNDYSKNVGINSELKALLLNKVVVGNGKKLIKGNTSLTTPPPGFDSVSTFVQAFRWMH